MTATITYRKTRQGDWVAYGPASDVKAGNPVVVAKKSGETETRHVNETGKPFTVDGVKMVYGYLAPREISEEESAAKLAAMMNSPAPASRPARPGRHMCDECGKRGGKHHRSDSSGIPGLVCDRCNRESSYALSFA